MLIKKAQNNQKFSNIQDVKFYDSSFRIIKHFQSTTEAAIGTRKRANKTPHSPFLYTVSGIDKHAANTNWGAERNLKPSRDFAREQTQIDRQKEIQTILRHG